MKRILSSLCTMLLILGLCGCQSVLNKDRGHGVDSNGYCILALLYIDEDDLDDVQITIDPQKEKSEYTEFRLCRKDYGSFAIANVSSGSYLVTLSAEGYETETKIVQVKNEPVNVMLFDPDKAGIGESADDIEGE